MSQSRRQFIRTTAVTFIAAGCGTEPQIPSDSRPGKLPQLPMNRVTATKVKLDHVLLQRLHEVDQHIRNNFQLPLWAAPGVGSVGLILNSRLDNGGYWCSPSNALTFATTGGDGDHYSLLIKDGVINEKSPVVLTWPSEGEQMIVGATLYDFLCFGMHGGYFQVLSGTADLPDVNVDDLLFHSHVEDFQQKVLAFMTAHLDLKPWPHVDRSARFQGLQSEFLPFVEVPPLSRGTG